MAQINGLEGLTDHQINRELENGARFVVFQYTISIVIMTFRRGTDIYFIRAGESTFGKHIGFTLLTLVLGWWGIPWGPIYTIGTLFTNLSGGKDVTNEILSSFAAAAQEAEEVE